MSQFTVEAFLKATGAKEFSNSMKEAGDSVSHISKNTKNATGGLGSFMGGIGKIAGAIGVTQLVSAGFVAIKNSVGDAVDRVDTLKRFPQMMEAMGFSADDSTKAVNRLKDGIQGLPTPLDDVVSTAQKLAIMTGDLDGATKVTLALNNAFLANGSSSADAQRGLQQYTQMLSSGKVDMQSWRTLQETMGVALDKTAKSFGFAGESAQNDLYAALQDGSITFEDFNNKIVELDSGVGGFAEMAQTASKGIRTSMTNIKTAITTGVGNAIIAVDEAMQAGGFGSISDNLNKVKVKVQESFAIMVEAIGPFIGKLIEMYNTITESTAFQSLIEVFGLVKDKFVELKNSFLESEAFAIIKQAFEDLGQAILDIDFVKLSEDIQEFIDKWLPLIAGVMGAIGAFKLFNSTMSLVTASVQLGGAAIGFLTSPIGLAMLAIAAIIAIGVLLWQNWDTIKAKLGELRDKFVADFEELKKIGVDAIETLKTSASEDIEQLKSTFTTATSNLKTSALSDFNELKSIGSSAMSTLRSSASSDANQLKSIAGGAFSAMRSKAVTDFNQLKDGGIKAWNTLKSSTTSIFNNVKTTISNAFTGINLFSAGKAIIDGFLKGLKSAYEGVKSFVGGIATWIKDHKGPISYDKKLLIGAGNAIMDGLDRGLQSSFKDVQSTVNGMSGAINNAFSGGVNPSMDINGSIARSNAQVNSRVSHEINNAGKQPAYVNFSLGGKSYRGFVDDISNTQNAQIQLTESYL